MSEDAIKDAYAVICDRGGEDLITALRTDFDNSEAIEYINQEPSEKEIKEFLTEAAIDVL